ncbi:MAG: tRNA 2-thiocytidine biosynthesis protein TtcA [Synergistaceae bacterium]|nr:tRNA 2-thiocytidine biosynthesis protein TtcA [Synergistaceae bacterium]
MIQPNDNILIGLSGGKDSLVLALVLAAYQRKSPLPFSLSASFVDITGGSADTAPLQAFCDSLKIPFFVRPYPILSILANREERSPCSFCANLRRGILNDEAKERGCNLPALAHTLDDAVETVLMNLFRAGQFKSFQPKVWQSRTDITVIRPLILAEERRVAKEAYRLSLPVRENPCPFSDSTERKKTADILRTLYAGNPEIKYNIIHALEYLNEENRWTGTSSSAPAPDNQIALI